MVKKTNATLKEVANSAGVHVSTASRALTDSTKHLIGEDLVKKVERIAIDLGYRPNRMARALRTNKSHAIGVIVPDIANAIFPPIIKGIEDALGAFQYLPVTVNLSSITKSKMTNIQKINLLQNFGIDGFILATGDTDESYIETILNNGFPVVMVNRYSENSKIDCVINDDSDGIKKAFAHLWNLGHRKIIMISGPKNISTGKIRSSAFKENFKRFCGKEKNPMIINTLDYTEPEGFRVMSEAILSKKFESTAIICGNDRLAIGAIEALNINGYNCPKDVSIVGFNDMPLVERLDPALTTIAINSYGLGLKAADRLISRITSFDTSKKIIDCLPVELKIRASTCGPRI